MILDYDGNVMFTALRGACPVYVDTMLLLDDTILPLDDIQDASDATPVEDDDLSSARIRSPITAGFPKIPATHPTRDNRYHRPLVSKQPILSALDAQAGAKAAKARAARADATVV